MNFGQAMEILKAGGKVERAGWNGKGLWVALCDGSPALPAAQFWNPHARAYAEANGGTCAVKPYMLLKTAQGDIQMGWAPSGPDAMAEDWRATDDSPVVRVIEPQPPALGAAYAGYSTMQPHQQRVVDEKAELDEKLVKLSAFLDTPIFAGLDEVEQRWLRNQAAAMALYSNILTDRIAAFTGMHVSDCSAHNEPAYPAGPCDCAAGTAT